ncbi:MAG: GAF domain-containing protein [Anaerolineae bacterium]|nr:MAG: GAF domain-containing protein [Anaerolineae bacterium]
MSNAPAMTLATEELRLRNARRVSIIRAIGGIALLAFLYYALSASDDPRNNLAYSFGWVLVSGNLLGLLLVLRRRLDAGLTVSVLGLQLSLFGFGLAFAGFGSAILVGMFSLTTISVANTVPQRLSRRLLLTASILGLVALLVDLFIGVTDFRIQPTGYASVLAFAWGLIAVLVGVNIVHLLRQFSYFSLRTKLITSLVAVTIIALGLLGAFNNYFAREILTNEANKALLSSAHQIQANLLGFVDNARAAVTVEARLPIMSEVLPIGADPEASVLRRATVIATLRALRDKDPDYIRQYTIYNLAGEHILDASSQIIGPDITAETYFQEAAAGNPYVSPLMISPVSGESALYFSAPIQSTFGETVGVLVAEYDGRILQDLIARSNDQIGPDSFAILFDEFQIHLAHGIAPETIFTTVVPMDDATLASLKAQNRLPNLPTHLLFHDLPELSQNIFQASMSAENAHLFTAEDIATGERTLQGVAIALDNPPWTLAVFQPQDVFLAPVEAQARTTLLLALVVAAAVVAIAIGLAQVLTRPIASLTRTAAEVSQGNLGVQAEVGTDDEIGVLAQTFNTMTVRLRELVTGLERQVAQRTQDLQQRAEMLQVAAEIARDATREVETQDLLDRSVELIAQRFSLYHVGIYINDLHDQVTRLMAGSDEPGSQLVESEHRLRIGSETNVGYVTLIGEARLARPNDPAFRVSLHPLLPASKSQLVVPLRVGEQIIGAIDMQSERGDQFREEDLPVFRSLADQIAIAIQKNDLRREVQQTLTELESAYGRYTRESWRAFVQALENSGYRYRQLSVEPINTEGDEARLAWERGETVLLHGRETGNPQESLLAVPMKVRGEVVGVLNLKLQNDHVPQETATLIEEVSSRLSLVLENARLVEVAQRRVQRERLTTEITGRMRQYLDIDSVLKIAIEEIGRRLELPEVEIRLRGTPAASSNGASHGGSNGHTIQNGDRNP